MVREVLKLKTDNGTDNIALLWEDGGPILWEDGSVMLLERQDGIPFKDIEITEYSFKSPRMGMPTLTAELYWPTCLDDEWTGREFVELRGERYYIRQAQSSEISNNNVVKYKHSLDFKSEREILGHVYFYDVVPSDILQSNSSGHDKPNTNSTTFKFFGTPYEFADRLNCAFRYAGIGDSILKTKTSLRDADTPVGDGYCVVVSGWGDGDLSQSQEFSFEDKWLWDALTEGFNKFKIPFAFHGKKIVFNEYVEPISHVFKYGFDDALLSVKKNNANARIINRITFKGPSENIPYYYPNETEYGHVQLNVLSSNSVLTANDFKITKPNRLVGRIMSDRPVTLDLEGSADATIQSPILFDQGAGSEPLVVGKWYEIDSSTSIDEYHGFTYSIGFSTQFEGDVVLERICGQTWNVDQSRPGLTEAEGGATDNLIGQPLLRVISLKTRTNEDYSSDVRIDNNHIVMSDLPAGEYVLSVNISWVYNGWAYWWRINQIAFEAKNVREYFWRCGESKTTNLLNWGVEFTGTLTANAVGDGFKWSANSRMPFQTALMPPKYRATLGAERFYNALNNTYLKPDGKTYYTFKNPYVEGNPNEYIHTDDTIKPTIEGVENSKQELFGVISDVSFDVDDNDSLKGDVGSDDKDKNDSANYEHSFFYIRLNKFDGPYGFDLFKSASQTDPMTIQMTSGRCNGCKFKIQVIESVDEDVEVWSNPVQTLEADGDIVTGTQSQIIRKDNPQTWQQDTTKNYIWIAVQKDAETFGVIMPNRSHDYLPEAGDTFNIINIDLPQGYIEAAEERGKFAMLDFMENNNEEKFTFDITASRIFFAENPDLLAAMDENSRIKIEYNGKIYEQYVSEFAIDCKNNEVLPDVKLTLADTLEPSGSFVEEVVAQAADIATAGSRGGAGGGTSTDLLDRRYLRRDRNDRTAHRISSDNGFEVGNFVSGSSGGIMFVDPETGQSTLEVDYFKARVKAIFETLEIAHIRSIGGKLTITPGGSIDISFVEELDNSYRCYFKQKEDAQGADCRFVVGDDAICQSFNISNGSHQNASNKYYWRAVTAVSNDGSYIELSKKDCASGSDIPEVGDTICQLGSDDVTRRSAIILSTVDTFSPNITLYDGVTDFTLAGKEMVDMGVDQTTHKAYFHVYGDAFIGDKDGNSYAKYDNLLKELEVKAKLNIASTIGDKTIDEYFGGIADTKLDGYSYLRKALRDVTSISGGLMLTGLIRLGESNADPNSQIVWAGHNGIYGNGRTIGSWWGGDMLDVFKTDDTRKTIDELKTESGSENPRAATSLVRMDGSAYFANGNIGFRKDGSGWLGNDLTGIKFGADGSMTFGSGVKIDVTGSGGVQQTLEDVINFNVGLTNLLKPCDKDNNELTWSEATKSDGLGGIKAKSLKAKVNFWSVGGVSALGEADFSGGGSGGGTGSDFGLMKTWPTTNPGIGTTDALGANLGYELHTSLSSALSRIAAIEPLDHINFKDTRNAATLPNSYNASVRANFKLNTTNGLSDGGSFNAELYFRGYGSGDDLSGGRPHELAFTINGNIWHRMGTSATTWGAWHKILTDGNYAALLDGEYVKKSGDVMNGALSVPRINILGTAASTAYVSADGSSNMYFEIGGRTLLVIDGEAAAIRPGVAYNDVFYLGATFSRWKCVYACAINVTSEVHVQHLNADMVDGRHLSDILASNVASATKLQTSRYIWGQPFNGTQNITGALSGATDITASGDIIANRLSLNGGLNFIEWDNANSAYKVNGNLYATGGISCLGFDFVSSNAVSADAVKCNTISPKDGYAGTWISLSNGISIGSTDGTYIGDAENDTEVTMVSDLYFGSTGGNHVDTSGNAFLNTVTINGAKFTVADGEVYVTIGGTKYKLTKTTV